MSVPDIKPISRLLRWSFFYDQEPFEFFEICMMVLTSLTFFGANDKTEAVKNGAYIAMMHLAPMWVWGTLTIGLALFHLSTLLRHVWLFRKTAVMGSIIFWLFLWILFEFNTAATIANIFLPMMVLFMSWVYIRLAYIQELQKAKELSKKQE